MTVRTPQAESGSTRQSTGPYAALRSDLTEVAGLQPDAPAAAAPEARPGAPAAEDESGAEPSEQTQPGPPVDGRRAHRAARQQRRHLAVGCAVLIAACLVITILIVAMARSRTPGTQVMVPALAVAVPVYPDSLALVPTVPFNQFLGVSAPEGGHR
jgi:hypothetical protein